MRFDVYLPRTAAASTIDAGSGIVGTLQADTGRVLVDYEGNRHGAANIVTYADRVHHAAGRHAAHYPTVARSLLDPTTLIRVGTYDDEAGEIDLGYGELETAQARQLVAAWCGLTDDELEAQLLTAGSARHQMRREVHAAWASGDPQQQFAARHMNDRHQLGIL